MQVKTVKDTPEEKVYAIVFLKGDEVLSGLTDFARKYKVGDAHFTGMAR
jgi:predicted DNA-binding protein with PD1-like motif